MTGTIYDVVVTNQILDGKSSEEVIRNLGNILKLSEDNAKVILEQPRTVIKKGVNEATAGKLRAAIEKCSLLCELVPQEKKQDFGLSLDEVIDTETKKDTSQANNNSPYTAPPSTLQNNNTVFCRQCGAAIHVSDRHCPACGAAQLQQEAGRSKVVAGFLAFFLGPFGVHRFYLGQWWGIFYIPLIFFGISRIVSLVEAIVFWCTSKERWNEKYGHLPPASGWLIVLIIAPFFLVFFGILAAVAIPAYQDYTIRAQVNEGIVSAQPVLNEVDAFYDRVGFIPNSNIDAGLNGDYSSAIVESINIIEGGQVVITYNNPDGVFDESEPPTIIFSRSYEPNVSAEWDCTLGSIPNKFRSAKCRPGYQPTAEYQQ